MMKSFVPILKTLYRFKYSFHFEAEDRLQGSV